MDALLLGVALGLPAAIAWWLIQGLVVLRMERLADRVDGSLDEAADLELLRRTIQHNMRAAPLLVALVAFAPVLTTVFIIASELPGLGILAGFLPLLLFIAACPRTVAAEAKLRTLEVQDPKLRRQYEQWRTRWQGPHVTLRYDRSLSIDVPLGGLSLDDGDAEDAARRGGLTRVEGGELSYDR